VSRGWKYIAGDWQVQCDVCSRSILASEARHRWDGLIVCAEDYESRHPMDFIRVKPERQSVPFSRPEPPDLFVDVPYVVLYVADDYIEDQENYILENEP
jgi:hypothetical protein